jgi:hypothetical protein
MGEGQNAPCHLIELQFDAADGGTVYITDSYRAITYNGNSYIALGALLDFGACRSRSRCASPTRAHAAGRRPDLHRGLPAAQYLYRRLVVYKAFLGTADALVVDPFAIHDGRMDEPKFDEDPDGGKCT